MNDVDMDLFIDAVEKTAPLWTKEMKSRGLLKFSMNRVWNKGEVFRVVMTYEYKNRQSFEATGPIWMTPLEKIRTSRKLCRQPSSQLPGAW